MATSRSNEERLLTEAELELVTKSRHSDLKSLDDKDVLQLVKRLRERRDRAMDIANKQRRGVRGKAGAGSTYDKADSGNRQKAAVLAEALSRVTKEHNRRSRAGASAN